MMVERGPVEGGLDLLPLWSDALVGLEGDSHATVEELRAALEIVLESLASAAGTHGMYQPGISELLNIRDMIESHLQAEVELSMAGVRPELSAKMLRRAVRRVRASASGESVTV